MVVRLMSFNTMNCLNFFTHKFDFDIMAKTIIDCKADIIGLQEMRGQGVDAEFQDQAKILAENVGFKYYYFAEALSFGGVNPYGNAIISRYPIKKADTFIIPVPEVRGYDGYYEQRCFLKSEIDVGDGLTVCVSHFGLNPDEQERAVKTCLDNIEDKKCILMGDFNVLPDNAVIDPIRNILFDTASLFGKEKLSFPSNKPEMKLDYIFTSKDLKVIAADIPEIISSDHRPYIADIEI